MIIVQFFDPFCQGKMEVEQIHLAHEVRTGYRDGRVSRHAVICCEWVGSTTGAFLEGIVGDCGKEYECNK